MRYAENTKVNVEKIRYEIERTLARFGANRFAYGSWEKGAVVCFQFQEKQIKFALPLPDRSDEQFCYTPTRGTQRSPEQAYKEWERACKQRWRALGLAIKAKLECVESGIESFETTFLPYVVLPDGKTVAELVLPAFLQLALRTGDHAGSVRLAAPDLGMIMQPDEPRGNALLPPIRSMNL